MKRAILRSFITSQEHTHSQLVSISVEHHCVCGVRAWKKKWNNWMHETSVHFISLACEWVSEWMSATHSISHTVSGNLCGCVFRHDKFVKWLECCCCCFFLFWIEVFSLFFSFFLLLLYNYVIWNYDQVLNLKRCKLCRKLSEKKILKSTQENCWKKNKKKKNHWWWRNMLFLQRTKNNIIALCW